MKPKEAGGKNCVRSLRTLRILWLSLLVANVVIFSACDRKHTAAARSIDPGIPAPLPVPPTDRFATKGVYFLVSHYSITTSNGVFGYVAGTKMHRLGNQYVAPDGKVLNIDSKQLTNDLAVAQQAAGRDLRAQAVIRQEIAQKIALASQRAQSTPVNTPVTSMAVSTLPAGPANASAAPESEARQSATPVIKTTSEPRPSSRKPVLVEAEDEVRKSDAQPRDRKK